MISGVTCKIEIDAKTIESYKLKVEKKEPGAALFLGWLYANGDLGKPDIKTGWALILREYELNNEYKGDAALQLGRLAAADNLTEACYWLLIAAKIPSPRLVDNHAFTNLQQLKVMHPAEPCLLETLAICYDCGYGTLIDRAEAYRLFRNAQYVGSSTADFCLGLSYEVGLGVPKDLYIAKTNYETFAKKRPQHPYARLFNMRQKQNESKSELIFKTQKFD